MLLLHTHHVTERYGPGQKRKEIEKRKRNLEIVTSLGFNFYLIYIYTPSWWCLGNEQREASRVLWLRATRSVRPGNIAHS